jgi:hypothetical protein
LGAQIRIVGAEIAIDIIVMNGLLNTSEIANGERPTQYMLEIWEESRLGFTKLRMGRLNWVIGRVQ